METLESDLEKLQQTNQRLVELVENTNKFTTHRPVCASLDGLGDKCSCGLDELRAEIKKAKGP